MTIYKDLKIGSSVNGTSQRYTYNITSSVSSVSGADANGNTLAYDSGFADVYLNGVRLSGADITITSGNSVSFASNLSNGDVVDIVAYGAFTVASVNADNISSGTVPDARITGAYTGITSLKITSASSGVTPNASGDELLVEGSANSGITIGSGTSGVGSLFFADSGDDNRGSVQYLHSSDDMRFMVNGNSEKARIDSSGRLQINTTGQTSFLNVNSAHNSGVSAFKTLRLGDTAIRQHWTLDNDNGNVAYFATNGNSLVQNANANLIFQTGATERMRIHANGVGIGTSSPSTPLEIASSDQNLLYLNSSHATNAKIKLQGGYHSNLFSEIVESAGSFSIDVDANNQEANSHFRVKVKGSEKVRINSSGNLLVGKSSSSPFGTSGHEINANGEMFITRTGTVLNANRNSSDGRIINILKDGTSVGTIGVEGGDLNIGTGIVGLQFYDSQNAIRPFNTTTNTASPADNAIDLGRTVNRFKDIYLGGGAFIGGTGTANKLDDYEEGTWTPSVTFGGGNTGVSSGASSGSYTKVGRMVYASALLLLSNKGSSTGNAKITGLPFSMGAGNSMNGAVSFAVIERISFNGVLTGTVATSNTTISLLETASGNNTAQNITNSDFNNSTALRFNVTYQTD